MANDHTCLIVDDDPFQCKLLAHQLAGLGADRIETCTSAAEVLDRIDQGKVPDLLILDLNLPEMDGLEMLRHLAARHFGGALILVSGEDEPILATAARLAREHGLCILGQLRKPVTLEALSEVLVCHRPRSAPARRPARRYAAEVLSRALDEGQLCGFYQPKVRVADAGVVGAEYLVRWRHPEDGLVFPDAFVPLAEAHGLIGRLTMSVLDDALGQLHVWRRQGLDLTVAVNVSMADLSHPGFADRVLDLCRRHGVAPEHLVLEVTESRLERTLTAVLEVLGRLRLNRLRLAIDDFGTGHSSLTRLRDLPFDELKIDRSFTHRAWQDDKRRTIFESSLEMGRRLGLTVVAEGVEDAEDWDYLKNLDHDLLAQGYHIARPMPAEAFSRWLTHPR